MSERSHGADLTPTCDRCGRLAAVGGLLDMRSMGFVCFDCVTDEERAAFGRGESPFRPEDDD